MRKGCVFLVLIFLACMLMSAVSATEDFADYTGDADNEKLILEENIGEDISSGINEEDSVLGKTADQNLLAGGEDKEVSSQNAVISKKSGPAKSSSQKELAFKTVSKGSKDKAMVKKIQKALKKNGYYIRYKGHYLKVDGWYGPCTFKSVKQFQKDKGLKVTGNVDAQTAEKLKIIDYSNSKIIVKDKKTFIRDYKSGKSFEVKIVKKSTGKAIDTIFRVDYFKNGKKVGYEEYYYTGKDGINYVTPDSLKVGSYCAKISCSEGKIKAQPITKKIVITKTSIRLKAKDVKKSGNSQLKATLKFKNNEKVNEGKVKFTVDGKSYTVNVKNGLAIVNLKNLKSKEYKVEFLGTKNIKSKSATGKLL